MLANQVMGAPASCLFWGAYESFKYHYRHTIGLQNDMLINFLSGMSAECVSCVLWLPIDIIKERQQVEKVIQKYHYKNSIDAVRQITQHEGVLGLYRAYGATIMSFGPLLGVNLMLYERLKQLLGYGTSGKGAEIPFLASFSIALISGTVASLLTNPLDLIKVRMQVQRVEMSLRDDKQLDKGRFGYRNVFHGISQAVKNEGALSLWKGCGSRILHMALQAGINLSLLEKVRGAIIKRYQR